MVVISAEDYSGVNSISNPCSEGPSYWCQHISNAKSCHAVKHCIQAVWEKQIIPQDNDGVCEICKQMVQEARDQLMSNETQEDLKEVFEGSCALIPVKMIRQECIKVSDGFVPELIEMLASQMNPTVVCSTAGLCNNAWSDRLQAEYKAAQLSEAAVARGGKCDSCSMFMMNVIDKLQSKSKDEVLNVLFDVCGRMSSLSDGCHSIVVQNIDYIYDFIIRNIQHRRSELCKILGICDMKVPLMRVDIQPKSNDAKFEASIKADPKMTYSKDDLECEFCEALVKHVREILVSNTTEEEFKQVLQSVCKQTGSFAEQCVSLTTEYYDALYAFLIDELNPREACRLLTLCPNPGLASNPLGPSWYLKLDANPSVVPVSRLFPAEKINQEEPDALIGGDEKSALQSLHGDSASQLPIERYFPESLGAAPKNPGCVFCEYVMHQIVDELHNQTVEKSIEQVIKNICDRFPSSISTQCDNFVDAYGDAVLFLLSQQLDPSVVCATLQLCPGGVEVVLPVKPFKAPAIDDPNTCALCEFVINELEQKLTDNKTEESIKFALENVCEFLPKSIRKDCVRLIDAYTEQIVEMFLADLTPDEVCTALKLCKPKVVKGMASNSDNELTVAEFLSKMKVEPFFTAVEPKQIEESSTAPITSPTTCVMCEFAMEAIDKMIIKNSTEEQIKRTIDFVCGHLPDTVADMCIDFVEMYGDEIFDMLVQQLAPKMVCKQMGLCAAVQVRPEMKLLGNEEARRELGLPSSCSICKVVIEYLDKLLEDETIEDSIDHIIEKACRFIPTNAQAKCKGIVDTYGPYFMNQLGMMMEKTKVCQSVHLCKPPAGHVQLLGGKQCTWGPTYWCVSPQHADACNALEHCQTKVWMSAEP